MKRIILWVIRILQRWRILTPIRVARLKFFYKLHRWPDFEHPKDINEKINWLKFYGDTSKWSMLADKYAVRGYLESIGYGDLLVGLYGKWDNVDDIDWDSLPDRFVMKINSGCGDVVICRDKSKLDKVKVLKHFNQAMSKGLGDLSGEPHYSLIKSCIIAEELLDASTQPCSSGSMVDYKIWCFAGVPKYIACCYNREGFRLDHAIFDTDWHYHPEWAEYTAHCRKPEYTIPLIDSMVSDISDEIAPTFKAYGNMASVKDFTNKISKFKTYFEQRPAIVYSQMAECLGLGSVYPMTVSTGNRATSINGIMLTEGDFDGAFFSDRRLNLCADAEGYVWE